MIYCFDIDGTLLETKYDDEKGYIVRWAKLDTIELCNNLYNKGNTIIIQTGRHWNWFDLTVNQLNDYGIKYHALIMGNVVADAYINDKAFRSEEFLKIMEVRHGE